MWAALAKFILRNRIVILATISLITIFMAYEAFQVKIAYNFTYLLPASDSASIEYDKFKQQFGLDGTVMVAGMQEGKLFSDLQEFNDWYDLNKDIKKSEGIKDVISVASLFNVVKNDSLGKFELPQLLKQKPTSVKELDSVKHVIMSLPFYEGFLLSKTSKATLMLITFKENDLNTAKRLAIVDSLKGRIDAFANKYHVEMHYSGMPYIRTVISRKILNEMVRFLFLAVLVTTLALFLFFRSAYPVIFPMIIVIMGVAWATAFIGLFGYRMNALTSLIAPLITVIGVPNCILLLNKYHTEFRRHGNQGRALAVTIKKIGVSLFLANVTTSIGFAVFCFTRAELLFEFGLITSISIMATYMISLFLVPIIFSYLPPPDTKNLQHLQRKHTVNFLSWVDKHTQKNRVFIYGIAIAAILISAYGVTRIKAIGYVVDDLPKDDPIYTDMHYIESHFGGVLPFEIKVDARKPNGVFANNGKTLYKIEKLGKLLKQYPFFSRPISVLDGVKYCNQAYHDGEAKYYIMPSVSDLSSLSHYLSGEKQKMSMIKSFMDSTKQYARVELQMADIGSVNMNEAVAELTPRVDSVFNYNAATKTWLTGDDRYKITFTGGCLVFLRGNDFLLTNLMESVLLAILLVSLVMYTMFTSSPLMVLIATIPTLIPQLITLGLMGFFHIHLKPSTILIFSIAFGISSGGTMYFLTKYKQELKNLDLNISQIVSIVIKETGLSMIYTAVILSGGFLIFVFSGFGGTKALGLLLSITLIMAYCSNLIILPSFMLSLEKRRLRKMMSEKPLIDIEEKDEDAETESDQ
jgi:predicted RND superfamily exporter protein